MIQSRRYVAAVALACLMLLGGCEKKVAEGTGAAGEVLEGTISDAMIATDETRSKPPLAPHTASAADAKGKKVQGKPSGSTDAQALPVSEVSPPSDAAPAPKPTASEPAG